MFEPYVRRGRTWLTSGAETLTIRATRSDVVDDEVCSPDRGPKGIGCVQRRTNWDSARTSETAPSDVRKARTVWRMGWEALEQWGEDAARIEPLAGGVANDVWSARVEGHLTVGRLGTRTDAGPTTPPASTTARTTSPRKRRPRGRPLSAGTTSTRSGGSPKYERSEKAGASDQSPTLDCPGWTFQISACRSVR